MLRFCAIVLLLAGCADSGEAGLGSGSGGVAGMDGAAAGAAGEHSGGTASGGIGAGAGGGEAGVGGVAGGGFTAGGIAGGGGGGGGGGAAGMSGTAGLAGSAGSGGATHVGPIAIMPLGDSITVGSSGTNAGYRGPLYALLKKSAIDVVFVGSSVQGTVTSSVDPLPAQQRHNEGHASYTINDISHNLDGLDTATFEKYGGADRDPNGGHWFDGIASGPQARPALYPDVITLMVGTNNAGDADRAQVQAQLHALLTKITTQRPQCWLIVAQITPSNRPNNVSYNAAVATEVGALKSAGKLVRLVDLYTGFPADGLSADQVHPNDKGYGFMARKWSDAVIALGL